MTMIYPILQPAYPESDIMSPVSYYLSGVFSFQIPPQYAKMIVKTPTVAVIVAR